MYVTEATNMIVGGSQHLPFLWTVSAETWWKWLPSYLINTSNVSMGARMKTSILREG